MESMKGGGKSCARSCILSHQDIGNERKGQQVSSTGAQTGSLKNRSPYCIVDPSASSSYACKHKAGGRA